MSSSSFPRMLLHTYTEPQWLLKPNSETSSLDRLEAAEAAHWEAVRAAVLPETPAALGIAADETKTFGLQTNTEAVNVAAPPNMSLQSYWEKYGQKVENQTPLFVLPSPSATTLKGRSSDVSMDISMSSNSAVSLSFASPTSRTG